MRRDLPAERYRHSRILVCLALVMAVFAVYGSVLHYGFAPLDDDRNVTRNVNVSSGLTPKGLLWAFSFNEQDYWYPISWLSHTLDCEIYGLNPQGHHLSSILLHLANALLLFLFLERLTGNLWQSSAVAALFAVHPLNVESVVWIASRKNPVSTLFWFLTLWAYIRYVERPGPLRYLGVFTCLALGLMAKPMIVTLPLVLLLLDFWPLRRLHPPLLRSDPPTDPSGHGSPQPLPPVSRLLLEKGPLLFLSLLSVVVSMTSSQGRGILVSTEAVAISLRVENALISYVTYLWKMIWPANLTLFYPYPQSIPVWQSVGAGIFLVAVTFTAVKKGRQAPYFLVGWAWYLLTLLPVIGLVQQGLWPAWADRFAYVPLIGPFIIIAWGIPALLSRGRRFQKPAFAAFVMAISALGLSAWHQTRYWSDGETLLTHAIEVAPPNHLAHYNMGALLLSQGRTDEALSHYSLALKIMPRNPLFHYGLGSAMLKRGRYEEAVHHLEETLRLSPGNPEALTNLGAALREQGKLDEAMVPLLQALSIKSLPEAHHNLGLILAEQGRLREAVSHYERAMGMRPGDARIHNDLAVALYSLGEYDKALVQLSEALKIDPGNPKYLHNLRSMRKQMEGSHKERETGRNP